VPLREQLTASAKPALAVLFAAAMFLLVIACTNVSNLLIARASSRDRELAVRLTMGAGRWRVTRQLLAESVVMCLMGGGLGVFLAMGGVKLLLWLKPANLPRLGEISVSWPVMAFALAVSTLSALALGVVTALRIPDARISSTLSGGSRTSAGGRASRRLRETLVVTQVAMTLVLLSGAGLLVRSFERVLSVDVGYRTDDALVLDITVPRGGQSARQALAAYQRDLVTRLSALPGVTTVGLINDFPLGGGWYSNGEFVEMTTPTEIQSFEDRRRVLAVSKDRTGQAGFRIASVGYFEAMGVPLLKGRLFATSDKASDDVHVAVISKSLADAKWPDQDPIGRFIQFGNMDGDVHALRIVGVVGDVREFGPEATPGPLLYALNEQRPVGASRFSVIVRGPPSASVQAPAQRIAREIAPEVPVTVRSAADAFDRSLSGRRFNLVVIGTFAGVALALAMLGLYGLIAYLSNQRRREFGIRVALGARGGEITRLVLGKSLALSLTGIVLGVVASFGLTRLMQNLLFGVTATDPAVFCAVALLMLGAVGLASYLPARRATRAAPMTGLRVD
jgi:putative ABC transport system permease protein